MSSLIFESNNPDRPIHELLTPLPQQQEIKQTIADRFFKEAEEKRAMALDLGHLVLGGEIRRGSDQDVALRDALASRAIDMSKVHDGDGKVMGITTYKLDNGDEIRRVTVRDTAHMLFVPQKQQKIELDEREL